MAGIVPGEVVNVLAVAWHGPDAVSLTYESATGDLGRQIVYRDSEQTLANATANARPFDAPAHDFRLAAEAQRIRLAGLHDPMLAVATSDVRPLPHQIRAVYEEMLPRSPLRYLLAHDPGAGKTIMAGLFIKELMLREDVRRCLVVVPGGLVDQWQDELWFKFGLEFAILTAAGAEAALGRSVFEAHNRLIVRMDQVARNEELMTHLGECEWDLVIVDEAHRMSANAFSSEVKKSLRFQLGEVLGQRTRHFLLMTATPHAGKDEDFQLFLSLLDRDLFEGKFRRGSTVIDAEPVMGRAIKEDLLTFEGKPLFPERIAETLPYELVGDEILLYDEVTEYVRNEMNRADALDNKLRRNTVGFALTVLQRRLASSPEAIYQSLNRRAARLEKRRDDLSRGVGVRDDDIDASALADADEWAADDIEQLEDELVDAATAARTVEELDTELVALRRLIRTAARVRGQDTDRKWTELRSILEEHGVDKLIVFTEHRDTLDYLHRRITSYLGRPEAVVAIHGGVRRSMRREITEEFTHNRGVRVLLATDAAGEGLNLQAAHLMVNYDLPWNPNRIEQRFGRIHRIGQLEVCRLWNLVATNTREGEVFARLLDKIEEQRKAYGGKVFDVLGAAFENTPLRSLLMEAVRYGGLPETRARMHQVIDDRVSDGLRELIAERGLAHNAMTTATVAQLRRRMEEARAMRLQPHFIADAFGEAFKRLGGRMSRREAGRWEITQVPAEVRHEARGPVPTRYERITFELDRVEGAELSRAELIAPGHPLHDAVLEVALSRWGDSLERGSVLISTKVTEPEVLVGVIEEIADATGESIAKRFSYAYVNEAGAVRDAGPAPCLDCVAAPGGAAAAAGMRWLAGVERLGQDWLVAHRLPEFLHDVSVGRGAEVSRLRTQVAARMNQEINRLAGEAMAAQDRELRGLRVREGSESLTRKRLELEQRLDARLAELDKQGRLSTKPPRIVAAALVLPFAAHSDEVAAVSPMHAVETQEVERRGVDAVLAAERALGREPEEMAHNNKGFDVRSASGDEPLVFLEVKARIDGAEDFFVTHSEVRFGQNATPHYRLALVRVDPRGPEHDELRYVDDPFRDMSMGDFAAEGVRGNWAKTWARGSAPH
ncbi:MAG: helicase-related protein [Nocardioides sp.]